MIDPSGGAYQSILGGLGAGAGPTASAAPGAGPDPAMMQLMNLLRQAFGGGGGQQMSAGLNSLIPAPPPGQTPMMRGAPGAMPGAPSTLRGTAPGSPWPSGGTFGGLR